MLKQDQLKETLPGLYLNCCSETCSYQLTEVPAALSTFTSTGAQEFQVVNWAEVIQKTARVTPFSLFLPQDHKLNSTRMGLQYFPCGWLFRHLRSTDLSPHLAFDHDYINRKLVSGKWALWRVNLQRTLSPQKRSQLSCCLWELVSVTAVFLDISPPPQHPMMRL